MTEEALLVQLLGVFVGADGAGIHDVIVNHFGSIVMTESGDKFILITISAKPAKIHGKAIFFTGWLKQGLAVRMLTATGSEG